MIRRPFTTVLFEAIFIGLLNLALYLLVSKFVKGVWVLIITGALIHLLFEYSPFGNINEKWCKYILK
jgi:hypothetical protein